MAASIDDGLEGQVSQGRKAARDRVIPGTEIELSGSTDPQL